MQDQERTAECEPRQFAFVLERRQQGIRSHAMREYWKERHRKQTYERRRFAPQAHSLRTLLPNPASKHARSASDETSLQSATLLCSELESNDAHTSNQPDTTHKDAQPRLPSSLAALHSKPILPERGKRNVFRDGVPAQILSGVNHAIASSTLGPFDVFPVKLTAQHHKLLHHWFSAYATMMFDQIPGSPFNPMRDVWIPLDFSNAASLNMVTAHSAAHIAAIRGVRECREALQFKTEAVRIVKEWLGNPDYALSDDLLAAAVRLLSHERSCGTDADWRLHRDGIERMVSTRGGASAFQTNWRLQLVTNLVSITSSPSWFDSSNLISQVSQPTLDDGSRSVKNDQTYLFQIRSLWLVSLLGDLRKFANMSTAVGLHICRLRQYCNIQDAVLLLHKDSQGQALAPDEAFSQRELERLSCVLLITIILQESTERSNTTLTSEISHSSPLLGDLVVLDIFLEIARDLWQNSVNDLHTALFENTLRLLGGRRKNWLFLRGSYAALILWPVMFRHRLYSQEFKVCYLASSAILS